MVGLALAALFVATWAGALYTVSRALQAELGQRDRQETTIALVSLVAIPALFVIAPIRSVTGAAVREAAVGLGHELYLSALWLFGLGRADALNAFEAVFRGGTFVLIIVAAMFMSVAFLWAALWLLRSMFGLLNLTFQWFDIDWVLPELQPARWQLSQERAATSSRRGRELWGRSGSVGAERATTDVRSGIALSTQASDESARAPRDLVAALQAVGVSADEAADLLPKFPDLPHLRSPQRFFLSTAPIDLRWTMRPVSPPGRWLPMESRHSPQHESNQGPTDEMEVSHP